MAKNEKAYDAMGKELERYIDSEKQVLELACGTGQITFLMADKALEWTATDYSKNMVNEALKRKAQEHPECKAEFETADATKLTYQNEQFDVVVIANALHIMPDPDFDKGKTSMRMCFSREESIVMEKGKRYSI